MLIYWLLGILAAGVFGFVSGWETHSWKVDASTLKEVKVQEQVQDTAAVAHQEFIERERVKYVKVYQNVDRIVRQPFYLDGPKCLDDSGLREINTALGQAASQPAARVPASGPTP